MWRTPKARKDCWVRKLNGKRAEVRASREAAWSYLSNKTLYLIAGARQKVRQIIEPYDTNVATPAGGTR